MANHSLGDRAHTVNHPTSSINEQTNQILDLIDQIDESLGNAQALLTVAYLENFSNCSPTVQQRYLSVVDDLINTSIVRFRELSKVLLL